MKVWKRYGFVLLLYSIVIGGGALAARDEETQNALRLTRFRFSETLHWAQVTQSDGNSTDTRTLYSGQTTIDFELPARDANTDSLEPSTPITVKAGSFVFHSTLGKDPDYRSGKQSVTLKLTSPTPSGKSLTILGTAHLRWDGETLTGKIDAKIPAVEPVAAKDFVDNDSGGIEGETRAQVELGSIKAEAQVPFRGHLSSHEGDSGDFTGRLVTITLRGESKKPYQPAQAGCVTPDRRFAAVRLAGQTSPELGMGADAGGRGVLTPRQRAWTEDEDLLGPPAVGVHRLRILTPSVLELFLVTTKQQGARVETWDFVDDTGTAHLPTAGQFSVLVEGKTVGVDAVGFKRRVLYAPLRVRDLRIGNYLYLRLVAPVPEGAEVEVKDPQGALWAAGVRFLARADRLRGSPAIHVNQVGYMPAYVKEAMVGYYLGSLGELDLQGVSHFSLIDSKTGKPVYSGVLKPRLDTGWSYATRPYQHVLEADFSAWKAPGEYRLWVPGMGVSLPFRIDEGTAAAFARAYALGLYHQRCGAANALPFTRFVHAPCHTAPADVPTMAYKNVQRVLAGESANYKDNPRHTAPQLKDVNAGLYPFVRQGKVDVSGGHHDAGDYSKYTINSAQLIHYLVFAADNFPGAADLDNLGLPESGDGKSDLLQIAKWEADFLAKMQDDDGGFYFLVYPRDRAYEQDVLPDHGDPQVVFPKTTAVTAAATAALAQAASSPRFKREFPEAAALYLRKAKAGWAFLERAWARYGMDGSYQKITHYGDVFMHDDEIAWAAAELYLATGEQKYHAKLRSLFDPSDKNTLHWGWERLFDSYGCAIRSYAFGAKSGRVTAKQLDPVYLQKCRAEIMAGAQDHMDWSAASAYGTSFPTETKRFRTAGWYFSTAQAFDIVVADLLDPRPERMEAILGNLNYEAGCNPNNVVFVTGLGLKRQREIVDQYALNDRRVLPPSGIPLGSIQEGFMYLDNYKGELGALSFPPDGAPDRPYPFYDRWGDSFNVATEFTIPIQGRCLATLSRFMALSPSKNQPWRAAGATIEGVPAHLKPETACTVTLKVEGMSPQDALIVWESDGQEPVFGTVYRSPARQAGRHWIEAEAQWPDGRRAFAATEFEVGR